MVPTSFRQGALAELGGSALCWLAGWWRIVHLGALIVALALSPSSYGRTNRSALLRQIYVSAAPNLPWFTPTFPRTASRGGDLKAIRTPSARSSARRWP